MNAFVRFFLLNTFFLVSFGYCFSSCSVKSDDNGGEKVAEETSTPTLETDVVVDEDIDGDLLVGEDDPNSARADIPDISLNVEAIDLSFQYQDSSGIKSFTPAKYTEGEILIRDKRRELALVSVGNFIKTRNSTFLRRAVDIYPSYIIRPLSPKDSVANRIDLKKRVVRSSVNDSGEVELSGTVSTSSDSKFLTNAHYVKLLKNDQILAKTLLGDRGVDISLSATTSNSIFSVAFSKLSTHSIKNLITTPSESIELSLDEYSLKREGREIKYSDLLSNVQTKTLSVMIIDRDDIKTHFIVHEGSLRDALLKVGEDASFVEEDGEISEFLGLTSTLNPTTNISDIEQDGNGKWFVISSRALSLDSKVGAGDAVTLIYATGEEIASSLLSYSEFELDSFTGASANILKKSIDKAKSLSVIVDGVKKFGSRPRAMSTGERRYPNGCHGREEGEFLENFESSLSINDADSIYRLEIEIDAQKYKLNNGFYSIGILDQMNIGIYDFDSNNDEIFDLTTLYVNSGNIQGSTPVRLTRNTCYNSEGQYSSNFRFSDVPIKTYFQYNLNFLIEHY